jgi:hypothetical protein
MVIVCLDLTLGVVQGVGKMFVDEKEPFAVGLGRKPSKRFREQPIRKLHLEAYHELPWSSLSLHATRVYEFFK